MSIAFKFLCIDLQTKLKLGGIQKGERQATQSIEKSSCGLLLQRDVSRLGLKSRFIQTFAMKSDDRLAGAPLLGSS